MESAHFDTFWRSYSEEGYTKYALGVDHATRFPTAFRLAEAPIFFDDVLVSRLEEATYALIQQLRQPEFMRHSESAIPNHLRVPNLNKKPEFLQFDFALCEERGSLVPKLIELQGFASMFCFQVLVDRGIRAQYPIPADQTCYFSGLDEDSYLTLLKRCVLGDHPPEETILLELHPEQQKTRIDFSATEAMLGIQTVCLTKIQKEGRNLYYKTDGRLQRITRIYNRVILDELLPLGLNTDFDLRDDVDVEWAAHPDWFMRISKHSLPFLEHPSVPKTYFANQVPPDLNDWENWVLKPLFSFAGAGVKIQVRQEDLNEIPNPSQWILQRKVDYARCVPTPAGPVKAEVRMMVLWDQEPVLANTLVRLSKGETSNVAANTKDQFVGATTGYHAVG